LVIDRVSKIYQGLIKLESKPFLHPLSYEELAESFHYYFSEFNKVGIIGLEAFSKGKSKSIFEAKNQVIKALLYEREQLKNFLTIGEVREKMGKKKILDNLLSLFFPVIIFDGHMYELEYRGDKPTLNRSHYIQYLTSFSNPTLEDQIQEEFVIDIVDINFLSNYLKILDEIAKKLLQKISILKNPSQAPK